MLKVFMVPLDTSKLAEQALPHALMLARHAHARLHLVCVRFGRAWLGSVADSFLRIAPRPVLLIRVRDGTFDAAMRADRGISHIVIPLDGSDTAEQVIPYALELGSGFDARYSLIRVLLPQDASPYAMLPGSPARPDLADYLERRATPLRAQGLTVTARVVDDRSPAHGILQYVATHGGDAIALATAGAGCIGRWSGSGVTQRLGRPGRVSAISSCG